MPTNKYFSGYNETNQQQLYRDLIDEVVKLFGIDCIYIPRTSLSQPDLLFGDDPTKAYSGAYFMAVYIQNVDGFEGPGDLFTKFGLVINKQLRLLLGNTEFQTATTGSLGVRAREGDIIWMPNFQALWEIKFVNADRFFYAFGAKSFYGWELICEEFRYNNETITTGYDDIDNKVNDVTIGYQMQMNANGIGTFIINEKITQANTNASAYVLSWNLPAQELEVKNLVGSFQPNNTVVGVTSNAHWTMSTIELAHNVNDNLDDNLIVRNVANTDFDQSESNPLQGDPLLTQSKQSSQ
ncbi:MAG: hypothetical protein ACREQ5_08645 [Candidatus Dormibacteria bacterium]